VTHRKPITSITAVLLPSVTYLPTLPCTLRKERYKRPQNKSFGQRKNGIVTVWYPANTAILSLMCSYTGKTKAKLLGASLNREAFCEPETGYYGNSKGNF
jgi:hypothetical protein